jgi:peptidoglycan/xylan/chitin deacetylase (PgdA/CDA1 family)
MYLLLKNKTSGFIFTAFLFFITSCSPGPAKKEKSGNEAEKNTIDSVQIKTIANVATILSKKEVPVLCYHHIREAKRGQSETMKSYSVSPAAFADQMKALKDNGYETILPGQLYEYLVHGRPLPSKPVMLTFDDTDEEQFTIGASEMNKYGFKGVYFIMTIAINRPRYMSKEQLKQLSDSGDDVEAHTWDHHMVTRYKGPDFDTQFAKPKKKIEEITGKPAEYFAYPFGLWNQAAIPELKKAGYKMAFILSTKRDSTEPLYTIRRMIVPGQWSTPGMLKAMKQTFHL